MKTTITGLVMSLLFFGIGSAFGQAQNRAQYERSKQEFWTESKIDDAYGLFSGLRYRRFDMGIVDLWAEIEAEYDIQAMDKLAVKIEQERRSSEMANAGKKVLGAEWEKKKHKDKLDKVNARRKEIYRFRESSSFKRLFATVQQVTADGLLLKDAFLVNYPFQGSVTDGQYIQGLVRDAGNYQFTTVLGATRTVRKYDFGQVVTVADLAAERARIKEAASTALLESIK